MVTNPLPSLAAAALLMMAGCDRMITPRNVQITKDADRKVSQGDYLRAINLYEAALDDTPRCAEIHYKLALLYDDKLNDPLSALHHFKRYLTLSPDGPRSAEIKKFIKRDEVMLATSFSGDSIVTRAEAARLKNENLKLRKELADRATETRGSENKTDSHEAGPDKRPSKAGKRTYVVQPGDTLVSISRKFYKSPRRWKQIRDANKKEITDVAKLHPGQTLTIP